MVNILAVVQAERLLFQIVAAIGAVGRLADFLDSG